MKALLHILRDVYYAAPGAWPGNTASRKEPR